MTNEQIYATKMAINARLVCVKNEIIDDNVRKLDFETLQNIVNLFGGKLFKDEKSYSYYRHISKLPKFDICIGNDIKPEDESITILMTLGIPFFDNKKLNENCKINITDFGFIDAIDKYSISYQ